MKVALIDHYDSFTANVIDWLESAGLDVEAVSFDHGEALESVDKAGLPLVISPGPKSPEDAAATVGLVQKKAGNVPILGVCLGHQILGCAFGARVRRAHHPRHGTVKNIHPLTSEGLFDQAGPRFSAAVYNSLVLDEADWPPQLRVAARCEHGDIQAITTHGLKVPAWGVQFHPESFLSEKSDLLLSNWIRVASGPETRLRPRTASASRPIPS